VRVRSPSLARGYRNNAAATRATFVSGELRTGDQGFVADGLLYLTGRLDGLLLVNGRSLPAEPVESRVAQALGTKARSCAVVQTPDTGRLALLIEPARDSHPPRTLTGAARAAIATFDFAVDSYSLVGAGQMPRTPSGKVRRARCREIAFDDAALRSVGGRRVA
jgi:acyl-CoA synthetase (AMP-forming)/AMP-acid ligase II